MIRNNESSVRVYSREDLLERVKSLPSFKNIPDNLWLMGIQSIEDNFNKFDDIFILFKKEDIITSTNGTTNSGVVGLKNYEKYNGTGVAIIKTNEWYYNLWTYSLHKGIMPALKQIAPIKFYRDTDKDNKAEETGKPQEGIIGINFHTISSFKDKEAFKEEIGESSVGCQVVNHVADYFEILNALKDQRYVTYCLLKEF